MVEQPCESGMSNDKIQRTAAGPDGRQPDTGSIVEDLEALFPEMQLVHSVQLSGPCEWALLSTIAHELSATGGRLAALSTTRYDDGSTCVQLKVTGIKSDAAQTSIDRLNRSDCVATAQIEHRMLRSVE